MKNKIDESDVEMLLVENNLVNDPEVSFLAEGHGHYIFLVEDAKKKMVFRQQRNEEKQFDDSLVKEYSFLRYARNQGLDFVPEAIAYNEEHNFLLESFLPGKETRLDDFTKEQMDVYAYQLGVINNLNVERFFDFCDKHNLKKINVTDRVASLQKYGFNRFEEAKTGNVPQDVISWMDEKLHDNLALLKKQNFDTNQARITWGDAQAKAIIDKQGNMYFYDFEHVGITYGGDITYLKIHGHLGEDKFKYLLDRYAHHTNQSKKSIQQKINREEQIIRVNDVVWAAMKWAKTEETEKFKDLTHERIELAESVL